MRIPQFKIVEFIRLLERVIKENESYYHCEPFTVAVLSQILVTDYPEQEDDIEFLMDMINYQMRTKKYTGRKSYFPVSKHLDQLVKEPLYINARN